VISIREVSLGRPFGVTTEFGVRRTRLRARESFPVTPLASDLATPPGSGPSRGRRRPLRSAARLLLVALVAWLATSAIATWILFRRQRPRHPEPVAAEDARRFEDMRLATRDGEDLGALFVPAPEARVAVLVVHGQGGSRTGEAPDVRFFADQGLAVLCPTLRAHGDSSGGWNDFGWSAREDVIACVAELEKRAPGLPILVFGRSLGAVAAIYAGEELGTRVSTYLLEAPYRDLAAAAHHRLDVRLPPPLNGVAYLGLRLWAPLFLSARVDELRPLDRVAGIPCDVPIVLLSGTDDALAPIAEVAELRDRCSGNATLVSFPGGTHVDITAGNADLFRSTLLAAVSTARDRGQLHAKR
jgi:alpha-beta hydrolase superfamily lysophospholipase